MFSAVQASRGLLGHVTDERQRLGGLVSGLGILLSGQKTLGRP